MKKIILIVMVCFLIPCIWIFNQASASNSSIEGTLWRALVLGIDNLPDGGFPHIGSEVIMIGFHDDKVYVCSSFFYGEGDTCPPVEDPSFSYIDSPVISMAYYFGPPDPAESRVPFLAIMQPIGIGYLTTLLSEPYGFYTFPGDESPTFVYVDFTGIMVKESDDWLP